MKMNIHETRLFSDSRLTEEWYQDFKPKFNNSMQATDCIDTGEKYDYDIMGKKFEGTVTKTVCNYCGADSEYNSDKEPSSCSKNCLSNAVYRNLFFYKIKQIEKSKRNQRIEMIYSRSGIKGRLLDYTFENFKVNATTQKYVDFANNYCDNWEENKAEGIGLILQGQNGTGKSHLSISIAHKLIKEKLVHVRVGSFIKIAMEIRKNFDSENEIVDHLSNIDLLVLDDFGKEKSTPWIQQLSYLVINERYEKKKPTIITTNYSGADLNTKFDTATIGRLIECCHVMKFSNVANYRTEINKTKLKVIK